MKTILSLFVLVWTGVHAFQARIPQRSSVMAPRSSTMMLLVPLDASVVEHIVIQQQSFPATTQLVAASPLQQGIRQYSTTTTAPITSTISDTSLQLALKDRVIPTAEEIAQKKMTFNAIFWGGGFVAPFLATIFYFGFKFWEK